MGLIPYLIIGALVSGSSYLLFTDTLTEARQSGIDSDISWIPNMTANSSVPTVNCSAYGVGSNDSSVDLLGRMLCAADITERGTSVPIEYFGIRPSLFYFIVIISLLIYIFLVSRVLTGLTGGIIAFIIFAILMYMGGARVW